jgi:cytochrome c oxidase subunit 2
VARRVASLAALGAAAVLVTGCADNGQNMLHPVSRPAQEISDLWWAMMGAGWVVLIGSLFYLLVGWRRRRKEGLPIFGQNPRASTGLVVAFGIVIPVIVLAAVFVAANLFITEQTQPPAVAATSMTVKAIGHQWWWEFRYPGTRAVTANELHIPVNTKVNVVATTADVIHDFWVPELNRKIDMIPGHPNRVELYANKVGVYRGQCAEFCGLQHAHMSMKVFVQPVAQYQAWLRNMASDARTPTTSEQQAGEHVFLTQQCSSCHTIRGTSAQGTIGPDLTHLATRTSLAAVTLPNDPGHLAGWVLDPQDAKPGNDMPGLDLTGPQAHAVLAYLESLK